MEKLYMAMIRCVACGESGVNQPGVQCRDCGGFGWIDAPPDDRPERAEPNPYPYPPDQGPGAFVGPSLPECNRDDVSPGRCPVHHPHACPPLEILETTEPDEPSSVETLGADGYLSHVDGVPVVEPVGPYCTAHEGPGGRPCPIHGPDPCPPVVEPGQQWEVVLIQNEDGPARRRKGPYPDRVQAQRECDLLNLRDFLDVAVPDYPRWNVEPAGVVPDEPASDSLHPEGL